MRTAEIVGGIGIGFVGGAILVLLPGESWAWALLAIGIALTVYASFSKPESSQVIPQRITPTLVEIEAAREQRAKTLKAEAELEAVQFEKAVAAMMDRIQGELDALHARFPGRSIVPNIIPNEDDDPRVFAEAKRRIEERRRAKVTVASRWR